LRDGGGAALPGGVQDRARATHRVSPGRPQLRRELPVHDVRPAHEAVRAGSRRRALLGSDTDGGGTRGGGDARDIRVSQGGNLGESVISLG